MFKKRALALAAVLTMGLIPTLPSYAVTTYASPADLIEDVVEVALTGVTSSTYDAALAEMKGKVTLTDNTVSYDGTAIGYWTDEDSSTIYTTEYKNTTVVKADGNGGWEVEPTVFDDILEDVNEDLIDNVVPATADWSKIIGKYDVTLGGVTIPADQWISLEPVASTSAANSYAFSQKTGIGYNTLGELYSGENITFFSYLLSDGVLYINENLLTLGVGDDGYWRYVTDNINTGASDIEKLGTYLGTEYEYLRITPCYSGNYRASTSVKVYVTNLTVTKNSNYAPNVTGYNYDITDPSNKATATSSFIPDDAGIAYITSSQMQATTADELHQKHVKFFSEQSSSRKVVGNTTLTKRLAKLSNLSSNDTIVFATTGWTVNGLEDLDSYISTSTLNEAGQSATMDGAVEIEELNFKVVVPSTLPMIADSEGNVTVASNATIANKSNAAVKISELRIDANPASGWEMVAENPEKTRGANEFTFDTSLNIGDTIAKGQDLSFSYNADLSPAEEGVDSVDLVTLTITLDWAE